ncbi:hypothetical protein FQZ97_525830 [compost metagenome]
MRRTMVLSAVASLAMIATLLIAARIPSQHIAATEYQANRYACCQPSVGFAPLR